MCSLAEPVTGVSDEAMSKSKVDVLRRWNAQKEMFFFSPCHAVAVVGGQCTASLSLSANVAHNIIITAYSYCRLIGPLLNILDFIE